MQLLPQSMVTSVVVSTQEWEVNDHSDTVIATNHLGDVAELINNSPLYCPLRRGKVLCVVS